MRKLLVLILLSFIVFTTTSAQNYYKGFDYIKQKKYKRAERLFSKAFRKTTRADLIVGNYGMALLYYQKDYPKHNIDKAYKHISKAIAYYSHANYAVRNYLKRNYNIGQDELVKLRDSILNPKLKAVLASKDLRQMADFVYRYEGTPQAREVIRVLDSADFVKARAENSVYSYRKFIQDHPGSYYNDSAYHLLVKLWKVEFDKAFHTLDLQTIERFEKKYPDYPYNPDTVMFYKDLAHRAYGLKLSYPLDSTRISQYVKFIKDAAPYEAAYLTVLKLAEPALKKHMWQAAADTILKYKKLFPHNERLDSLVAMLERPEKPLPIAPLKGDVNTLQGAEFLPVITVDDSTLYFCGENRKDNLGKEDIYVTHFDGKKWTKPHVVKQLSTVLGNEAPLSITADGNSLIIFKNGDIFITQRTKDGWSIPEPIMAINSDYWEADAFITADGNAILFASDRPNPSGPYHEFNKYYHGNFIGNTDIWVVTKLKNGHWSKPINLGQTINTPYAERSPFLHPDMKTLYFLSDGHTTLGAMDVLVSKRLSDTSWTQWSKPVNLGKYVNTPYDEFGFDISAKGNIAYYSRTVGKQFDIYTIKLPKKAKPQIVVRAYGYIKTPVGKPISAKIIWEDLETKKTLGQLQTDPANGYYLIALPLGKNYGFYISAQGYYPLSANVDLRTKKDTSDVRKDFVLYPIYQIVKKQVAVRLNNVFFDFNSAHLRPESYPELDRFAQFIKTHPNLLIEISGHTDSVGTAQYNIKLSTERAQAVKTYLVNKGCNPKQLVVKGYGFSKPVATNQTEEGRQKNRRVEFKVIGTLPKH